MRIKAQLTVIVALITTFGIIGLVETVWATPDSSQRLRGLAERTFFVTVTLTEDRFGIGLPVGTSFPNCYIFVGDVDEDGNNWFETAFPTKGTWAQNSNGARTSYDVEAGGLIQLGQVTPAGGKGVLQLVAHSVTDVIPDGDPDDDPDLEFLSVGKEIFGSEIDECPTSPIFTFPDPE